MKWCGLFSGQPTWAHGTFSPCLSETISAALLLALAALVIGTQYKKMRLLRRRGYLGKQTWTAASTVSAGSIALLALTHAVSLVFSAISLARKANGAPYNIFYGAAQLLVWTAALVRPTLSGMAVPLSRGHCAECLESGNRLIYLIRVLPCACRACSRWHISRASCSTSSS